MERSPHGTVQPFGANFVYYGVGEAVRELQAQLNSQTADSHSWGASVPWRSGQWPPTLP